jgi:cell division protein FtsI/penicillin-binding protein 2
LALAATLAAAALGATGCGSGGRSAAATAADFIADWNHSDTAAMTALMDRPAADFASTLAAFTAGLHATAVRRVTGPVTGHGSAATVPLTTTWSVPGMGTWTDRTTLDLARVSGHWKVDWTPATVAAGLAVGDRLTVGYQWAPRAAILGAGGVALTISQTEVDVGVEGSRIKNPSRLKQVLAGAGATAAQISSALAAAAVHSTFFEPVFELSMAAYQALGGNASPLYVVPGTVFQEQSQTVALTPGLTAHLVGTVGPITAQELSRLGVPYTASSVVGQGGLEAYYQAQLAGTPGGSIEVVNGSGATLRTLDTVAPTPGRPVLTSIDPVVQQAAEHALSTVTGTAAFVAVRVSTGQILASVSDPAGDAFDFALDGEFPPGSSFKVLTSTALFEKGLSPASPASCPPIATVDGEVFHNAEGDQPVSTVARAFAESCNTAFVQLAAGHLSASDFTSVASLYGIGHPVQMGYAAFAGAVPAPSDGAALAATAIGQAAVVVSPLDMAMVASAVGRGAVRPARLVTDAPDDSTAPTALPATVVSQLRAMMASVVTSGTAAGTGLPAGTYAKTGTAQYGSGNPLPIDAWLIGYRGDLAFAMVEQDSKGDGGPVDGPIVARFLDALPAAYGS